MALKLLKQFGYAFHLLRWHHSEPECSAYPISATTVLAVCITFKGIRLSGSS